MTESKTETSFKILIIGDTNTGMYYIILDILYVMYTECVDTGKTSFIQRYVNGRWLPSYKPTFGGEH